MLTWTRSNTSDGFAAAAGYVQITR